MDWDSLCIPALLKWSSLQSVEILITWPFLVIFHDAFYQRPWKEGSISPHRQPIPGPEKGTTDLQQEALHPAFCQRPKQCEYSGCWDNNIAWCVMSFHVDITTNDLPEWLSLSGFVGASWLCCKPCHTQCHDNGGDGRNLKAVIFLKL